MRGFSVLLVDGSVAVRRMLTQAFEGDARVGHVATAATAGIALAKIPQLNPDVVVVDLDLPESDPFLTVRSIRAEYPDLPVVVDSEHTHDGADIGVWALEAGATRCVSRPSGLAQPALVARVREALVPVLLEVVGAPEPSPVTSVAAGRTAPRNGTVAPAHDVGTTAAQGAGSARGGARTPHQPPRVLALGASTGGPDALEKLLTALPGSFPLPVLVVQHMPAGFTAQFARRLAARSPLRVSEARHGDALRAGSVLLAPGGLHMRVHREGAGYVVRLDDGTPENFCRPSVDVLFRSVAACFGDAALAVVLTGMGADGRRGAGDLVSAGSEVLIQDEASSTVWGMPGAVSSAGLASETLPLPDLAPAILRRVVPLTSAKERR